jgi:hypothetical protein
MFGGGLCRRAIFGEADTVSEGGEARDRRAHVLTLNMEDRRRRVGAAEGSVVANATPAPSCHPRARARPRSREGE